MTEINLYVGSYSSDIEAEERFLSDLRCRTDSLISINVLGKESVEGWKNPQLGRFMIPELQQFKGHAIYMDVMVKPYDEIEKLLPLMPETKGWLCAFGLHSEVSLINCERFNWDWWISTGWLQDCDWSVPDAIAYLSQHSQLGISSLMEWCQTYSSE